VNQRVGMTMHLPPLRSFTTKDQGHPQRPVLVRQTAHLAVLSFDRRHDHQVAGGVCLHDLQIRIARLEVSRGDFYGRVGIVSAADQFSARCRPRSGQPILNRTESVSAAIWGCPIWCQARRGSRSSRPGCRRCQPRLSRGCTQVLHAVHGMHPMYSASIPRQRGCSHRSVGRIRPHGNGTTRCHLLLSIEDQGDAGDG
jgi:hypothetical protein